MAYIGTSPTQAVRTRFLYTATASQTTFSGADTQNLTLRYSDANFVDVYQNGVLLKGGGADYTATTTTSVVLTTGATADDVIEIIVYDVFAVANLIKKDGDTVEGVINFNGKEITLDADFDTSITADTDDQIDIRVGGSDQIKIAAGEVAFNEASGDVDFRVESNGLTNAFVIDGGNNGIGFGHSPRSDLHASWTQSFFGIEGSIISQVNSGGGIAGMSVTQNTYVDSDTGGYAYMTTNEATKLDLKDGVTAFSRAASGTAGNAISFSESMRIDTSGNVLVGRTSTISGGSNSASGAQIGSNGLIQSAVSGDTAIALQRLSDDGDIIQFRKDTTSVGSIGTGSSRLAIGNDDTFLTFAGDLDALYPASSSSTTPRDNAVDLGTSGTRFKDLYLSNSVKIATATNGTALLDLGDTDDSNIGRIGYDNSDNSMKFTTNNSEAMRIDSSGNVMIGATSSTALLNVRGQTAPLAVMFNSDNSDKVILQMRHDFARGSQNATMIQFLNNDGDEKGSIKTSATATQFNVSSDYRLKENVSYDWDATARLKQLKPCRFNWISDETNTLVDGFLAHEVSSSVLQAVSGEKDAVDKDGKIKPQGIDHSKLVPLLTKSLQEALARIDTLEAEVKTLKGE